MAPKIKPNINWNIFENHTTITNPIAFVHANNTHDHDSIRFNDTNTSVVAHDLVVVDNSFDYIIIQAWWPEPEQKYVTDVAHYYFRRKSADSNNNSNMTIRLKKRDEDTVTRLHDACDRVNQVLRKKYLNRSALIYVGNIEWIHKNVPHCFEFDNIFSYEMKYDNLNYINQISNNMDLKCQLKFNAEIENGLFQRYDRIWLNKFNIMLNTTLFAQKILNINNTSLINNEIPIVWIDFGFRPNHFRTVQKFFENENVDRDHDHDTYTYTTVDDHEINAMKYDAKKMKKKKSYHFGNKHCNTAPKYIAAFFMMYYNTLKEYTYFYNDTLYKMFDTIQSQDAHTGNSSHSDIKTNKANNGTKLLSKKCKCFDEEIVIANTLKRVKKNKNDMLNSWKWHPMNE